MIARQGRFRFSSRPAPVVATPPADATPWREQIGAALERAIIWAGWSPAEAAAKVGVPPREFELWLSGARRAKFDLILAVEALRWPFMMALMVEAELLPPTTSAPPEVFEYRTRGGLHHWGQLS